ncbi:MAG: hypothetical protein KatS3mg057_2836 [Herpetosiphonaceae bacterium]|nr:MAG: hypothetical protein KatS3mg057_2836 [Herpetosiphonaceae bacterium]
MILWWTGEPPLEEQRFVALARTADRVILDSATYSRPLAQFQRQIAFLQAASP